MADSLVNLRIIEQCLAAYTSARVLSWFPITKAGANEVICIDTNSGKFVLRILKAQVPAVAELEAEIQQRLLKAGWCTPQYLRTSSGKVVAQVDGKNCTCSTYVAGASTTKVSPSLVRSFGKALAAIHEQLADISVPENAAQWLKLANAEKEIDLYSGLFKDQFKKALEDGRKLFNQNLPIAVIHSDLHLGNVFAQDDKITFLFDFETVDNNLRIIDIARTAISLIGAKPKEIPDRVIELLVFGYNNEAKMPLSALELESLPLVIRYVSASCGAWNANNGHVESAKWYADFCK